MRKGAEPEGNGQADASPAIRSADAAALSGVDAPHDLEFLGSCPACAESTRRSYSRPRGIRLWKCARCGLVYSDPQPRERVLEKYEQEYDLAAHFGPLAGRKRVQYERRLALLGEPRPNADRLCDVGCGDGQFLELAAERGWRPFGVELNPPAAAKARSRGADVRLGAVEQLSDLPWQSFDVVTSWDSIEHTPVPRDFAERLARLVRFGGRVALTTLNHRSLVRKVFSDRWSMYGEDHFTYWDRGSLTGLLSRSGLMPETVRFEGLGRDFVTWIDHLAAFRQRSERLEPVGESEPLRDSFGGRDGWDTQRATLAMEGIVNRVLNATGSGVGIEVVSRRVF